MRVLITGATGLLGARLVARLHGRGNKVVVTSRSPAKVTMACERVVAWDGMGAFPRDHMGGVDAVVHLAGESVAARRWSEAQKRRILESRVNSTRALATAMGEAKRKPGVLVCASAVGFYGDTGARQVDEDAPAGTDFLAQVCAAWEAAAAAVEAYGIRRVSVRLGVVLAREGGALQKLLPVFKAGLGGKLGSGTQGFPWIHVDDAVGLLVHAIDTAATQGPLNAVAPAQDTNADFTAALAHALHRPAVFKVPGLALELALGEMSQTLLGGQQVVPRQALQSGYVFMHPVLDVALRQLVER